MRRTRKILSIPAVLLLCLFLTGGSFVFAATLTDLPSGNLYTPYILSFFEGHIITGDLRTGKEDRKFRPLDPIARSEMAKITALTRLAEKYSTQEDWSSYSELAFVDTTENKLKPYYKCTASSCSSIGGIPFGDVAEKDPDCFEKNIATGGSCEPWYTQYVYYAVSYGYIKGYESKTGGARYFAPTDSILRIHALKMAIAENGNTELSKDPRYTRLNAEARARRAYAPVCLRGAETYILKNNGNDKKLLAYALLADRLDLFGKNCEVFGKAEGPQARADFLQKPVTRQEVPRYLSLTTLYHAVEVDSDPTVATEEENTILGKDDETYVSPAGPDVDPETLFDLGRPKAEIAIVPTVVPPVKKPKIPIGPQPAPPKDNLPAKIFQILPASTQLCGPFGCTTLKTPAEVEMLSVLASPYTSGKYVQNVSFDGQLYTADCEAIKSEECLAMMAKTAPAKTKPAVPANWIELAMAQAKNETEKAINDYFESLKKVEVKPVVAKPVVEVKPVVAKPVVEVKQVVEEEVTEKNIMEQIESFIPCGEAKNNSGLRLKPDGYKNCSYQGDKSNAGAYALSYAGIIEGEKYWQSIIEYIKYFFNGKNESLIKQTVEIKKLNLNKEFDPKNEIYDKLEITDLRNVFDLTYGGKLTPKFIILHRTDSGTALSAINTWTPAVYTKGLETLGIQYLIDKNGTIFKLSNDEEIRWHTAKTVFKRDVNNGNAIGIEVVGKFNYAEKKWEDVTNAQIRSVSKLTLHLIKTHKIKSGNVCPHEFVSQKTAGEGSVYSPMVLDYIRKNFDTTYEDCIRDQ